MKETAKYRGSSFPDSETLNPSTLNPEPPTHNSQSNLETLHEKSSPKNARAARVWALGMRLYSVRGFRVEDVVSTVQGLRMKGV